MSFLYQPGDLAQTPLAAILLEALNLKVTGALTVQHGGGASKLYLRAGVPVGAQVYVGFKPLGQYLLSQGLIDFDSLDKSLQEMARTGRSQGQVLVEMGAISAAALDRALADQQAGYVALIATLESGGYGFDADAPVPEWTRGVRLSPLKAIVDALEKPQAEALVVSALRQAMGMPVALSPGYAQGAESFGWSAREAALVGQLERPTAMEAFFSDSRVPPERARAALAALLLLGYAEPSSGDPELVATAGAMESLDLLEPVAGDEVAAGSPPTPLATPPAASATARAPAPAARSDPAEARERRQRLLAKAMQNMGIGPLATRRSPPPLPASAPVASSAAEPSPAAASHGTGAPRAKPSGGEAELRRALAEVAPRVAAKDFFERLGLDRGASRAQVKQAYLTLAKQFHPDRFLGAALSDLAPTVKELFTAVNEAYEVLSDDRKRTEYLARLPGGGAGGALGGAAQVDFKKGEACLKSRDFARARGFLEAAIRQDPRAEYQAVLAWCLLVDPARQDREKAKELVAEALRDPGCDRACYVAGILSREEGDEERAERMFRAALRANPKHLEAEREIRLIEMRRQKKGAGLFKKK
jgi:ribosomal protein S18 acetylase RimI-like enzyme